MPRQETLFPRVASNLRKSFLVSLSDFCIVHYARSSFFTLNFRHVDRPCRLHRESRDGQSASNHAIVKSDVRRTGNRSLVGAMRYVRFSISIRPRRGRRDTDLVIDATSAMHQEQAPTLRDDTEPTDRLIDWRIAPSSCPDDCSPLLPVPVNFIANRSPMESRTPM